MCGIAGIVTADGSAPSESMMQIFADALAHRGPDGRGTYLAKGIGLTQTRLAIVDLETGDQPLFGPTETVLVANGEIYNHLELRSEFESDHFNSKSDCEAPLHLYEREGPAFAQKLRGMYAIALADTGKQTLTLSRDPFGIKPLYYAQTPDGLIFASEPQAILKSGLLARNLRRQSACELLQLQFTTGPDTIYSGISRVLPGESVEVEKGQIVRRSTLTILPEGPPRVLDEAQALERLDQALMDSVAIHQRSDVPYGMFLSGGVDSSALLACMARLNERPVRAFTAGFPETDTHDEREHARRVAKAAGAEHIEIEVRESDFWIQLPAIAAAMDDPAADYAILPTYLLAREAAKELKVVLCGEGGDELFAGYGRYRSVLRPRLLGGRPMRRRGALDGLGVLRDESGTWRETIAAAERSNSGHGWTKLQAAQALDCGDWLANDLLIKLDRCLMAHSVEGRTPFLDPAVAGLAFGLPDRLKIAHGGGKYLLRRWLDTALPEAEAFSKKRGFTVPVGTWIAGRAQELAPLVARCAGIAELCHPDAVKRLFEGLGRSRKKRNSAACWNLLFYALWHRIHIEGCEPQGDVFALLEANA